MEINSFQRIDIKSTLQIFKFGHAITTFNIYEYWKVFVVNNHIFETILACNKCFWVSQLEELSVDLMTAEAY